MAEPTETTLERKLATILSADVAEYSRLMAEDEEQTLRTFRAHKEVFESLVALHRGRIFNTAGDAILAEFHSAVEAVRCATEIQAALRTRNDQLPPSRQVRFRIGVNLGDVMVQNADLLGDGVNVAARLQATAEPDGICIAGSVYDQIRNKLSLSFKSLGERSFKNIPQPVRTFAITDTVEHGTLPAPKLKWHGRLAVAAVTAALLVPAGGYWAYSGYQKRMEAARQEAQIAAERAAGEARRTAEVQRQARAVAPPPQPGIIANAPMAAVPAHYDGLYSGLVCYADGRVDPAHCYRAQGSVSQGKISGQWPGREPGITMILTGDVLPSGEVKIEMRARTAVGLPVAIINLSGAIRDGRLDATGSFVTGRAASMNWRKN